MNDTNIVSKVLVQEDASVQDTLRCFLSDNHLIGLKASESNLMEMLATNTDLGAIFISDHSVANGKQGLELGLEIHNSRPELPIFYRSEEQDVSLEHPYINAFAGVYSFANMDNLTKLVNSHLFINHYPMPLIRGIQQISEAAFGNVIQGVRVQTDAPYLVKDQIIFGELLSLIPLESSWCRGTMMLQTTQQEVMDMIAAGKTHLKTDTTDFRQVNEVLNEVTNLIWGRIKAEFFANADHNENVTTRIQVPTLVNHQEKYISFGSHDPQLCFKYNIIDDSAGLPSIVVYQKMVFNLSWSPEEFKESDKATDELVESGELEFF